MIQKITETIYMVFSKDGFTSAHAVLVEDDIRLMIDSGVGSELKEALPENVEMLINSHCHLDHINGNDKFTRAKIYAHPIAKESMLDPERVTATRGWTELMDSDRGHMAEQIGLFNPRYAEPWHVDGTIEGDQIIDCGRTQFKVLHTPGHTNGHCSFHFPDEDFIFTADICLSKVGPWYGDPEIDIQHFIDSAQLILDLKPKIITTSHVGEVITENIPEIFEEYIERIWKREKKIYSFLKEKPHSIDELCEKHPIYEEHTSPFVIFWEKCMIRKHLERLIEAKEIEAIENGKYYIC